MPSAEMYQGIAEGLAGVADYNRERPVREARVAAALAQQKRSELELAEYQGNAGYRQDKSTLELEKLKAGLKATRHKALREDTFNAFERYEGEGDTRHLNNFLAEARNSPVGEAWKKWVRFDPLTRNPQTEAWLGQAGITDVNSFFNDPKLAKSKIIGTDSSGQQALIDMNKLYQMTGYTKHLGQQQLKQLMTRAKIEQLLRGNKGGDADMIAKIVEEEGITYSEAAQRFYAAKNQNKTYGSDLERITRDLMAKDPNLSYEQAIEQASRLKAGPGSAEKDVQLTKTIRDQVHAATGGDFYSADLSKPGVRDRVGELITDLEKASGRSLSNDTKNTVRKLRSIIDLGGIAGEELSQEQVGLIDNLFHGVKKYFSDNVEGVEGTAAYSQMRNLARNALMGATLTPAEITSFNEAAGTLKQQLGPVLMQLKGQLQDIKGQIDTVAALEDPMVAKYYLGMSLDKAGAVTDAIDARIALISDYHSKTTKPKVDADSMRFDPTGKKEPITVLPEDSQVKPKIPAADRFKELTGGM